MKYLMVSLVAVLLICNVQAQSKTYKIVFDMASSDTADHSSIIKQVNNVLKNAPGSSIEIVFHGKAVYALVKNSTTLKDRLDDLVNNKGVTLAACNNSMNRYNITKEDLIPSAIVVPVAMIELADKQEKGWSYIRAGH
jgi:hypothetical protein